MGAPLRIIQWDQEKAFDRIDRDYLLNVLETFGFSPGFVEWIKLIESTRIIRSADAASDNIAVCVVDYTSHLP